MAYFGSSDYKIAGPMRKILIKTVNENLEGSARKIQCPTLLIYGENDQHTPPETGQRFEQMIPKSINKRAMENISSVL